MDAELQAGFSQLRELFPAPIPLELKDLVQIFGAQLAHVFAQLGLLSAGFGRPPSRSAPHVPR